jgi:hypothetical protein
MDNQKAPAWKAKADEPSLTIYIGYDNKKNGVIGDYRQRYTFCANCRYANAENNECEYDSNCFEGSGYDEVREN